jgi:hypothetical protein
MDINYELMLIYNSYMSLAEPAERQGIRDVAEDRL